VTVTAIAVTLLALSPRIRVAYLTALVLAESATPLVDGPIARLSPDPTIEPVSYECEGSRIIADLYLPAGDGRHPGIVLNHGVADRGKDDPRLTNFADALARAGYAALVPEFANLKGLRVRPSDVDEVIASYEFLEGDPRVLPDRVGLFGFSYAGGLAVLAASDPRISDRVRFCFLLGSHYDLENAITYMTTGMYRFEGDWVHLEPRNSGRWAFLMNSADLIESEADRDLLIEIAERRWHDPNADVAALVGLLEEEGARVYSLMVNDDPERTGEIIGGLSERVQRYFRELSLGGKTDRFSWRGTSLPGRPCTSRS